MRYTFRRLGPLLIVGALAWWATVATAAPVTPPPLRTATLLIPRLNLPAGSPVVGDSLFVHQLPVPLMGTPANPNNGSPGTSFYSRLYAVSFHASGTRLIVSPPRLLFSGPRESILDLESLSGGWLVYKQYSAVDPTRPWTLIARNMATRRSVVLDTSGREGLRSLVAQAASDGRTVVWQSWTLLHGQPTSVIRTYDLVTGRRRLLVAGGSPDTWSYDWPGVAGRWVVFEKELPYGRPPGAQILLADLTTGRVRPLTPATAANSEPAISGNIVVWKKGWRYENGRAVVVEDVRTGVQRVLAGSSIEQPKVTAGRYVIFPTASPVAFSLQLYDVQTGALRTLAGPRPTLDGYQPSNSVYAGGHAALFYLSKFTTTTLPNPSYLVVVQLPS